MIPSPNQLTKAGNMQNTSETSGFAGRWVSFREDIKVLDCTIRDGGLMNDSKFDDRTVKAVYDACVAAGTDYMEIGYKASRKVFARDRFGAWRFCDEADMRRIMGDNPTSLKISVMADAEKTDYHQDILPKDQSVIDMVRVATYIHQIPMALDMIKDANDKGYETSVNLMSVSNVLERELDGALEMLATSEAKVICLVDSFGALYSEQVDYLVDKYLKYAKSTGKEVGMHMHNNLDLAFSNTIQGIVKELTTWTPPWRAWDAARATAPWNCSCVSCTTPSTTCARCWAASRTPSSRCARNSAGASASLTCSPGF